MSSLNDPNDLNDPSDLSTPNSQSGQTRSRIGHVLITVAIVLLSICVPLAYATGHSVGKDDGYSQGYSQGAADERETLESIQTDSAQADGYKFTFVVNGSGEVKFITVTGGNTADVVVFTSISLEGSSTPYNTYLFQPVSNGEEVGFTGAGPTISTPFTFKLAEASTVGRFQATDLPGTFTVTDPLASKSGAKVTFMVTYNPAS